MKIQFIGTGSSINSKRIGASVLIEDIILVDAPPAVNSVLKERKVDFDKLSYIFVSHLHGDHYFGLPFLLMEYTLEYKKSTLQIYGPHMLEKHIEQVLALGFPNEVWTIIKNDSSAKIIELREEVKIKELEIKVQGIPVCHLGMEAYGFIFKDKNTRLLITADTELFANLEKEIVKCNHIIIDGTTLLPGLKGHISYSEIELLAKKFPEKTFYVTHRGEYDFKNNLKNIVIPTDGDVIYM